MILDIIHLFFPKRCVGCSEVLTQNENEICTICRNEMPVINPSIFTTKYSNTIFGEEIAVESFSSLFYFEKHSEVQELLHNLKYHHHKYLGKTIGDWHASILLKNKTLQTVDLVIPMPIHKNRLKKRGYNQVSLYAQTIAKHLNVICNEEVFLKIKHKKSQVFLTRVERFNNILDSICVSDYSEIKGKHILLVDDLITTGATMSASVSCLRKVECKISIASIALVRNQEV